jgi:5-methylcytosine-specific restriction protein A
VSASTRRVGRIPYHGEGVCRGCGKPVAKPRKTWCSDQCVTDALVRKGDASVIRRELLERDRGVCALCGLDCLQAERVLSRLRWAERRRYLHGDPFPDATHAAALLWQAWTGEAIDLAKRYAVYRIGGVSLWAADHIVPVVKGGGAGCGIDNFRTLCLKCHKKVTAELMASLAAERREAAEAALPLFKESV